ncbi:MAG: hypothetical protein ACK52I_30970 [Pseudomonadota bacterium]
MALKKEQYDLVKLHNKLSKITDDLVNATEKLLEIKEEENIGVAAAGFKAGQAYATIDKVYDELVDMTDDLDHFIDNN